jgi:phosphoadenosine phosphosulfate reductase
MEIESKDVPLDYSEVNTWAEEATPQQILRWAVEKYGDKLTLATAFGAEGCVILHMLAKIRDDIGVYPDVFNLDTGYQFGQTLALKSQIEKKYDIKIRAVQPDAGIEAAEARSKSEAGVPLYKSSPNDCCYWRKVVPLKGAVAGFEAWVTAVRRDQTPERAKMAIVGPDAQFPLVKINPLAKWSKQDVWDYIRANDVPYNPLHDQNFPSIGCWPCTRPVAAGQGDREGRWAGTEKKECGIHVGPIAPR